MDEFGALRTAIERGADERGLVVYPAVPLLPSSDRDGDERPVYPVADWPGEWPGFLDLAVRAIVPVVYIAGFVFDLDTLVRRAAHADGDDFGLPDDADEDEGAVDGTEHLGGDAPTDSAAWLVSRLLDRVEPWRSHNGEHFYVESTWFAGGVAHRWSHTAVWFEEYAAALNEARDGAEDVSTEHRRDRRAKESARLMALADEMARHDRFPEASSAEKRRFMALQLFPALDSLDQRHVASLANLIYWWMIEPATPVTMRQKAVELYTTAGMGVRGIAEALHISEAKIKTYLVEEGIAGRPTTARAQQPGHLDP